ncbi:MAG: mitochondrial fission ELM1 family protein [Verrucomicrobiales bacterium]|nr:mitochondrial fission ELM1 family protein [Verrucomicrobiales bacterium]
MMLQLPQRIRVLSDGRPGHENQSVGLAAAIARRTGATVEVVRLPVKGGLWRRGRTALGEAPAVPDLLIGAGHKVHLPMWFAARRFRARSVVIMLPTWPVGLFDLCLTPDHDLRPGKVYSRIIGTRGALNRLPEALPPKESRGVVLLGGPCRHHGWDGPAVVAAIREVLAARLELTWTIADSRRTPPGFLEGLRREQTPATLTSYTETSAEWLPQQLMTAQEVWVTRDSVSMVFEAITAGARTGLLPTPVLRRKDGPVRSIEGLVRDGFAVEFASWQRDDRRLPEPRRLHETARCAALVLKRLFNDRD